MTAKISVALCTYNGARYIHEQLASIACQTRIPDEVIICDDRSTDDTILLVETFSKTAPFAVHLHVNDVQLGSTKNFQRAMGIASGEIIFFCDQDDVWYPDKVESIVSKFIREPGLSAVFSDADIVAADLTPSNLTMWKTVGFDEAAKSVPLERSLLKRFIVTGATMAIKSDIVPFVSPIPKEWIHDGWIALLVATTSSIGFVDRSLIAYRQHADNQIGANIANEKRRNFLIRCLWPNHTHALLANEFQKDFHKFDLVLKRLWKYQACNPKHSQGSHIAARIEEVRAKVDFLAARWRIHRKPILGIGIAITQLLLLRYHRYTSEAFEKFISDVRPRPRA